LVSGQFFKSQVTSFLMCFSLDDDAWLLQDGTTSMQPDDGSDPYRGLFPFPFDELDLPSYLPSPVGPTPCHRRTESQPMFRISQLHTFFPRRGGCIIRAARRALTPTSILFAPTSTSRSIRSSLASFQRTGGRILGGISVIPRPTFSGRKVRRIHGSCINYTMR
jgi:hypothetical protein